MSHKLRVERVFALCDSLGAVPSVIGAKLWLAFLGDVYRHSRVPLATLKASQSQGLVNRAISPEKFIEKMLKPNRLPFPATFIQCTSLVTRAGHDPAVCLERGQEELKLLWIPDVRFYVGRNQKLFWDQRSYIELYSGDAPMSMQTREAIIQNGILNEIEWRGLCSGTANRDCHGFPFACSAYLSI